MSKNNEEISVEEIISDILVNVRSDRAICLRLLGPIISEIEAQVSGGGNIHSIIQGQFFSTAIKHIETMLKANEQLIKTVKVFQGLSTDVEEDFNLDSDGLNDLYNELENNGK